MLDEMGNPPFTGLYYELIDEYEEQRLFVAGQATKKDLEGEAAAVYWEGMEALATYKEKRAAVDKVRQGRGLTPLPPARISMQGHMMLSFTTHARSWQWHRFRLDRGPTPMCAATHERALSAM